MQPDAFKKLAELLEEERDALLRGQIDQLDRFMVQKELLSSALQTAGPEQLRLLALPLARNAALINAARAGVQDVLDTLKKQRAARTSLSSYDRSGSLKLIESQKSQTDQRF